MSQPHRVRTTTTRPLRPMGKSCPWWLARGRKAGGIWCPREQASRFSPNLPVSPLCQRRVVLSLSHRSRPAEAGKPMGCLRPRSASLDESGAPVIAPLVKVDGAPVVRGGPVRTFPSLNQPGVGMILGRPGACRVRRRPQPLLRHPGTQELLWHGPHHPASGTKRVKLTRQARRPATLRCALPTGLRRRHCLAGARLFQRAGRSPTTKHSEPSPTGSSVSSTAASPTTADTANRSPQNALRQLDALDAWDIYTQQRERGRSR